MKTLTRIGIGITLIATMTACSTNTDTDTSNVEETDTTTEQAENTKTTETTETTEKKFEDNSPSTGGASTSNIESQEDDRDSTYNMQDTKEQAALLILQESMESVAEVSFGEDTKTYFIEPTDPNLINNIVEYGLYGNYASEWQVVVDTQVELSNALQSELGSGYSIVMVNPKNNTRTLLKVTDGIVITSI